MTLYLSGGGCGEDSKELDKKFIKEIKNKKPILYIPLAREPPYKSCLNWIKSNFLPLEFHNFKMVESAEELKNINLEDYSGIYIGGGNTYKLLNELKSADFLQILKKFIESNRIVYGGSAGAIILGKNISTTNDKNVIKIKDFSGLNEVGNFSIYCHYNKSEKKNVERKFNNNNISIIALPEKVGLIIKKGKCNIVGKESAFIFNGENWIEFPPSKEIDL